MDYTYRWYYAVTNINDRIYWYNIHTGKLTDCFNPDCVYTNGYVGSLAESTFPELEWVVEFFDFRYYTGYAVAMERIKSTDSVRKG